MKFLRLINLSLQFTSRIPGYPLKDYSEEDLGRSGIFFPIIGLLIGGLLFSIYYALQDVNLITIALILIAAEILISGGLHLDGFMDTMDGLMSGTKGERMLEIMADSNVGAHSVSMLIALILFKAAFLSEVISKFPLVIILLPFIGRLIMLVCIITFPYPQKKGIGIIYKTHLKKVQVYLLLLVCLIILYLLNPLYLLAFLGAGFAMIYFSFNIVKKIKGLTGDNYGAIEEISKVVFLLVLFITFNI